MNRTIVLALLLAGSALAQDVYQTPPAELVALADAPLTPAMIPGPGDDAVLLESPPLLTIADLSQPELKLAGLRFNPQTHDQTRPNYARGIRLLKLSTGVERAVSGLPAGLRARWTTWAADGATSRC